MNHKENCEIKRAEKTGWSAIVPPPCTCGEEGKEKPCTCGMANIHGCPAHRVESPQNKEEKKHDWRSQKTAEDTLVCNSCGEMKSASPEAPTWRERFEKDFVEKLAPTGLRAVQIDAESLESFIAEVEEKAREEGHTQGANEAMEICNENLAQFKAKQK